MAPTRMKLRVRRRDDAAAVQPEEESSRASGRSSRRKNTSTSSSSSAAAAAANPSSSPPSSSSSAVASASARAVMAAEDASPDSKCPICLDRFNNLAYLDRCLHRFCFPCIQEWSHNKAECPLCKQPFASILHSVRAEDDFKEYTLRPPPANSSVAATVAMVAAMASAARSDHQMRLMLRRHRGGDGGESTSRRRRRERGGRGVGGRRAGVLEWYLDMPPVALPPLSHSVSRVLAEDSDEGEDLEEPRARGGADPSERGVIFEGLTGLGGAVAPIPPNDRESRRLMTRLAARQRLQREGGTVRRLRERETVAFRRALYRSAIRVRGVAGGNGDQGQEQHDITADSFRRNPAHLNRLRPWLRRELTVLYGAHGSLIDIVQRIIMARLARHGLEDTPTIEEELRPFLLARTDHFLHELVSFARSPLSLELYDLQAVYEPPAAAAMELDGVSSSSTSSSVIAISEGEEGEGGEGGEGGAAAHDEVIRTGSCLSLSAWDDETPGPSYSTAEPSCSLAPLSFSPAPQEAAANEEAGEKVEEEECLIVGYKKPIAERTPELVQLSSNSEEEEEEEKKKKDQDPLPSSTPPLSYLPTIPPSTSCAFRDEQEDKPGDGVDVDGCRPRARSWSGSSGRSRKSVCSLSPALPGDASRDRKREKRRRKRSRRAWERSGTLYNPNRSIFPAMMRRRSRSPSPFDSSAESSSLSPAESSWDRHQVSPLTSSFCSSSPASSPLGSSPQPSSQTPPTPSLSPSQRSHHGEKPGGKRKYKSRHLDDDKDPTWRPSRGEGRERRRGRREKERRRRRGRRERRRKEAQKESGDSSSRRCREERSPSVEIIYEGTVTSGSSQPPARKRRRKRPRNTTSSSSPVIITLDSDSSCGDTNLRPVSSSSSSSSPISSQQTVDFSDLPPLPLAHSAGVGGALSSDIGELPVDILDRGSDGSETEPLDRTDATGPIAVVNSDNSDAEVDVEKVEGSRSPLGPDHQDHQDHQGHQAGDGGGPTGGTRNVDGGTSSPRTPDLIHNTNSDPVSTSDRNLLATVLDDLRGAAPPRPDPNCSYSARKKRWRDPCLSSGDLPVERRSQEYRDQNPGSESTASPPRLPPPPLERLKESGVRRAESREAPPLLRQASPVQSYSRTAPPPLRHKDAGSPHRLPVLPVDLHPPSSSVTGLPADLVSGDIHTIPPVSTLRRPDLLPSDLHPFTVGLHHSSQQTPDHLKEKPPSVDPSPNLDFGLLQCPDSHSRSGSSRREEEEPPAAAGSPAGDSGPVGSSSPVHFQSLGGEEEEDPTHADSTSTRVRNNAVSQNSHAHLLHHSCGGTEVAGGVLSGANCQDASLPVFLPLAGSCSFRNQENPSVGVSRSSPVQVHPRPEPTVDYNPCAAPGTLTNHRASPEDHSPPPLCSDRRSPTLTADQRSPGFLRHLNHSALLCSSHDSTADSHLDAAKDSVLLAAAAAAKHHNHFDSRHNRSADPGPKRDFHRSADNHRSSSPLWTSSDSQSPVDAWSQHNHSAT